MKRKFATAALIVSFAAFTGFSSYSYGSVNEVKESIDTGKTATSGSPAAAAAAAVPQTYPGVVKTGYLNVRNGPWGDIIGGLKMDANVEIIGKEGVWFKINYNGGVGFIHSGYVETANSPATAYDAYVNTPGSYLNVRTGPWGDIIGKFEHGANIEILGKEGDWFKVKYNNREAFVHSDYITKEAPAAAAAPATAAASGGAGFGGRPVEGGPVTSEYGPRELYGNFHHGIDLGVGTGTPLNSIGAGTVVSAGWDYGGGNTMVIKYDNGYTSVYCHMQGFSASAGQRVGQGQQVGTTNNTGAYTTGPHLHFGMKDPSGNYVNPRDVPGVVI